MAIPATDLTNTVIVFERVWKDKGHDRNGSDTLVFGGNSPLGYVKNKVLLFFSVTTALSSTMIRLNRTIIWKDFSQYISKYMALKVWSLKCFEQCTSSPPDNFRGTLTAFETFANEYEWAVQFCVFTFRYIRIDNCFLFSLWPLCTVFW